MPPLKNSAICRANVNLSLEECARLERFAPLFDIEVTPVSLTHIQIRVLTSTGTCDTLVPLELVHLRLLSEICSKTVRWVHYRQSEEVRVTFFTLPEERLQRIAQLYAKWKIIGMPA